MSVIKKLHKNSLIAPTHSFCVDTHYEVMMGSIAYNVAQDTSDMDVHAICMPPVEMIFPHLTGYIRGFGDAPESFESFQKHHIDFGQKNYDVAIYSIVKVFDLASENNPNVLDMLWVPENCILHMDNIGTYIRQNRKHFLNKSSYHKFRGYAYAQLKKLEHTPRKDLVEKYGFDTKHAYHIIRLAEQCQQILEEGDMDITRCAEMLKSIRRGEWTLERVKERFLAKEKTLDELYTKSSLRYAPDMKFLREILMSCIEMKYGRIDAIQKSDDGVAAIKLQQIKKILES